jgi:hypothetical protein
MSGIKKRVLAWFDRIFFGGMEFSFLSSPGFAVVAVLQQLYPDAASLSGLFAIAAGSVAVGSTVVGPQSDGAVSSGQPATTTQDDPPPDPEEDRLGWENGVWHNESVDVEASDAIDREESTRRLDRTMARVELIRGVEL